MNNLSALYPEHFNELQQRAKMALARESLSTMVIHSGQELKIFLDDQHYPFKVNPHFKHWLPLTKTPNCWLIINGEDKPCLVYYQPKDFWHKVERLTEQYWTHLFEIKFIDTPRDIDQFLPYDKKDVAYIGAHIEVAQALGFERINSEGLINYLHYHRAYKTKYEQLCLRQANALALTGHKAAENVFSQGVSEYDIHQTYLTATGHSDNQLPYNNIVALNEHSAILHYTANSHKVPDKPLTLLIDAGASVNGYAADITRTYTKSTSLFCQLITAINQICLDTCAQLKPGVSFVEVHKYAYQQIAELLINSELVKADKTTVIEEAMVDYFFPHGIGHHLGLQTHDVGGFMIDERGTQIGAPKGFPYLRNTRMIEVNQVVTVEPGLYFIDSLLVDLKASQHSTMINWSLIDELRPYGGIRIEDNIIIHQSHNENMTRDQE